MKCPNCGAVNSNQAKFCGKCGIELVENHRKEETEIITPSNVTVEESGNKKTQNLDKKSNGNGALAFIGCCCLSIIILALIGMI